MMNNINKESINNEELFVSNNKLYERLQNRGIELMFQKLGKELEEEKSTSP